MKVLYDDIGHNYDFTRSADEYISKRIISLISASPDSSVLDIACGTGNYTVALQKSGLRMTGVDISTEMLETAEEKSQEVRWVKSDVSDLPFGDAVFDGCICTLAIHHFADIQRVFAEVYRVLKGGRFVIMTCSHRQIRNYWLYPYFPEALEYMTTYIPDYEHVALALIKAGFAIRGVENYFITPSLTDNFLGSRIECPEVYLDPNFRGGISLFARKAPSETIDIGCRRLRESIENNQINTSYRNPYGDYMFIITEK